MEPVQSDVERYFEKRGVWVTIPPQVGGSGSLEIEGPLPYQDVVQKTEEFELIRLVINFQVKSDGDIVTAFTPAMVLEVGLTAYDFGHLEAEQPLKLAFWDEEKEWVPFDEPEIATRGATVVAKVTVSDWGDPTVGLGR